MFVACHHRRHLGRLWVAPLCPSFTHNVRRFAHAFSHKLIYHGLLVCVSILGDGISSVGCPGCPPPPPPPHPQCSRLQIQHGNPLQRIIPILFSMFFFFIQWKILCASPQFDTQLFSFGLLRSANCTVGAQVQMAQKRLSSLSIPFWENNLFFRQKKKKRKTEDNPKNPLWKFTR